MTIMKKLLLLIALIVPFSSYAKELIQDFEWLEPNNAIEIVIGEPYQLHFSCSNNRLAFTSAYADSWVHIDFTGGQHVVDSPTGYSIDENGVITGMMAGSYAVHPTGWVQAKSGVNKWLYITVVSERAEIEPNNTLDTANDITSKIRFGLYNISDIDFFKYTNNKLKWGDEVTFKIHYYGSRENPFGYKWSTFCGTNMASGGSLINQDQECRALVTSGNTISLEVYYDQSRSEYFLYGEEFVVEVYINGIPASEYGDNSIVIDETNFPDANFRNYLLQQSYGSDGKITEEEIAEINRINVWRCNITSLKGIEYFVALQRLFCGNNQLTTLDVSNNTALVVLNCSNNLLTTLDLSNNNALTNLDCNDNQLTTLDISKNRALLTLHSYNNQLTTLDVSNNTELALLECYGNQLSTLDVSNNTALTYLDCSDNQLTELTLTRNTELQVLGCSRNRLPTLAINLNKDLRGLWADDNYLIGTLGMPMHEKMTSLILSNNGMERLNILPTEALTDLWVDHNELTTLNLGTTTGMKTINLSDNQLRSLVINSVAGMDMYMADFSHNKLGFQYFLPSDKVANYVCGLQAPVDFGIDTVQVNDMVDFSEFLKNAGGSKVGAITLYNAATGELILYYQPYLEVSIPEDIIGMPLSEAKTYLENMNLRVDVRNRDTSGMSQSEIDELQFGVVIAAEPSPGSTYVQRENNYVVLYYY